MSDTQILDPERVVENGLIVNIIDVGDVESGDAAQVTAENLLIQRVVEVDEGESLTADAIQEAVLTSLTEGRAHPRLEEATALGLLTRIQVGEESASSSLLFPFDGDQGYDANLDNGRIEDAMAAFSQEGAEMYGVLSGEIEPPSFLEQLAAMFGVSPEELGIGTDVFVDAEDEILDAEVIEHDEATAES
jgi:hypothetical protein